MSEITINTITDDFQYGFRLAFKNLFSYILAVIGMGIIIGLVVAVVAIPLAVFWMTSADPAFIGIVFADWSLAFSTLMLQNQNNPLFLISFAGIGTVVLLPIIGVGSAFIGPLYGISKEVVESGSTSAENAFRWLRAKFAQYALTGIGVALIVGGPILIIWLINTLVFGPSPNLLTQSVFAGISVGYGFLAYGLVACWFPAVSDGQSVSEGFKTSINLLRNNTNRIYGVLLGFLLLLALVIAPASALALYYGPMFVFPSLGNTLGVIVMSYTALAAVFMIFLGIPTHFIIMTRVYMVLSGRDMSDLPSSPEPEISLIGG